MRKGKKYPAIPILGLMTYLKERAPTEYAKRFAQLGYVALAFDPRYRGESSGDSMGKVEDAKALVKFLASLSMVDDEQLLDLHYAEEVQKC